STYELHGRPTSMQISPLVAPVRRGECYVRATLMLDGEPVLRLVAGYITDGAALAWPGGQFEGFTDGAGLPRTITGTNPAAGAEVAEAVPTNARWQVKGIKFALVTDATVADRRVDLNYGEVAVGVNEIIVEAVQAASASGVYTFYSLAPRETAFTVGQIESPLPPDLILFQGWSITTYTVNLQAGDNYGAPVLTVEEWIEE
ncbi:MAG: hypothetical protein Q8N53_18920, partial [Longimicrobiales bacterium]|nr:hypothetical protein [Longimicrobiales bacterium]